jgi:hypothetical protein
VSQAESADEHGIEVLEGERKAMSGDQPEGKPTGDRSSEDARVQAER